MLQKDPNFLMTLYEMISKSTAWQGAIMASVIAMLRVLYEAKEIKPVQVILEAFICGALSLCATSIIDIIGLPQSAAVTIGGAIGFIGVTALRELLLKVLNKKVDKQ